jgi:ketosteroid isomerase-like protein
LTAVEGKPIEQVRAIWTAYARGGVEAMRRLVGDTLVEWIPLGATEPVPAERFWGDWGRRQTEQVSVTVHSFEEHGDCVIAHGSMRTFSEGGFADVQPSWVYFFRDGVLVRGAGYPTREEALQAVSRWQQAE